MAPPPEYDKEPKAPDKTVTNITSEDSKALYNSVNEHQANSDTKSTNSSGNAEVENNKHVEALDDGQLRALLDEAITYKCPKDREGKSSLFKELLESVEQDEQACEAAWRAGRRRARGAGRRALPHSNSLQDLVAALAAEPAPRRRPPPHAPVSARALHGGSLPSGVDTSFLLSEEPVRGMGAEYVATVRCVNPSPLAERRVSASDAHGPHETEPLNRRSKPAFPMYTARATLEIGSGAGPGAGRAVTTTTASNQVRTAARRPVSLAPPGKPEPRGPRPEPGARRDPAFWSDDHQIDKWYRGLDHYTRGDSPFRTIPNSSINAPLLKSSPNVNPHVPLTKRHDKNKIVYIDHDNESNILDKNDDEELEAARKQYRERVGQDLVIPTLSSINPQNVRSMSIGRSLPVPELDQVGPNANTDQASGNKSVKDKHGRKTRNRNNRNSNVNVTDTPAPTKLDNKSGQSARPTKTCHDSVGKQTKPQSSHDAPKSNSNCDNQPKKNVNKNKDTKEMSAKVETRTSKPEKGTELVEMVPLRTTFKTDRGNEFSLFFANQQKLLQAIETNSGIQVETDNVIKKPDHAKSQHKEKEKSETLKHMEKNTKNVTNATERSASEEPTTVVKIGGMCFKVGTCEKSNPVLKKEPPTVVKIRGAPDFKVDTCEKSNLTSKKEPPTVEKIKGAPDFKETDNVIKKPDNSKLKQKEKEKSETLKHVEKNTKNVTNAAERSASEEPTTVVKIGGMSFKVGTCEKSNPVSKKEPPTVVKIRGAPDFKVGTPEKSNSTLKKEPPIVVKIRGPPDFKETDNLNKKPDNTKSKQKEKEKSETLKHQEKNTKNVTNATERSASEEPTTVVKIGGMSFKVGTCEKSNPVSKKEPPTVVKIRGAPNFKVGTCEKSNSTLKKEPPIVVKIRGATDFKETDNVNKKPDNTKSKQKEKEKSETLKHQEKNTKNLTNATVRSASEEPTTVVKIGGMSFKVGTCEKSNQISKKESPTVVKISGAPDFKVGTCEKSNAASKNEPPIVLTTRGATDFKETDNEIKKSDSTKSKEKEKEKSETIKHVEKNTKNVTNATERSASEEPTTVVKIGGMSFKVGTCEKSNPVLKKEPPTVVKLRGAPEFKVGTCEKPNPELKRDPPTVVKIGGAPDFKVATCEKSNPELKKEPPTVVKIKGAPDFKVSTCEKSNPALKKEPPTVVKISGAPDFKVGTCAKSSTAEVPTDHSIFLTLYKRLLASPAVTDRADAKRPAEPRPALAALDAFDAAAAKPPKKKKDKITARLARKPHNENSTKKKDIIRNALKKLFFDNITQSDSTQLTDNAAPASKSEEVDSAIPFSCISSPEVAPSADAAPAAPPDLKIPRNALASSFGAAARAVPALGASDEFKKSLDENGNSVPGFGSPQSGSGQQKKQRRKKTSKNETVIKSHHIDGYQGNKDLNEVLRFIESAPERSKHDKKKRSAERRAKPAPRASSLDDLRAPPPPRPAPAAPAKPERRSWGDERAYRREPEPELELADFQTVTKKRRARRRASPGPRPARARSPGAPAPAPRSDRSDSNDDVESVRSLPALPARAPASYADIARTRNNIPDLIESCNFYAESAAEAAPGAYPALEPRARRKPAAPSPPSPRAPDVVADRRPPVILLAAAARARDLDGVTFGFDVNEQLLGRRPPALPVRAGRERLRFLPPAAPADPVHLQQIVDYVGSAWEDAVRCVGGKVRYFSE